ncbi:hypothetical protein IFM89_002498 [Coptis chinensis]|uniref:DUF7745 domain-containing protein n=1 Tax=Coptis chinensis TaxID=261450 RepID=A0A835LM49_9MAGN|nr:hypothetical protein IFM89_002498 [Coptis chinensis]
MAALGPLLDKIKNRITSWDAKLLFFHGRCVLVKSVLCSLPTYSQHEEMDNLIMNTKVPNKSLLEIIKDDWDDGDWMDWRQKSGMGNTLSLAKVKINWAFIEALVRCWEPNDMVFKFGSHQLCPTLEECSHLLGMTLKGSPAFPHLKESYIKELVNFLHVSKKTLEKEKNGQVKTCSLDFLIARHLDIGDPNNKKVALGRANSIDLAIVGHILFPNNTNKIDASLCKIIQDVRTESVTVVPMILAELLIGLTNCVRNRHTKLSGCIPLLQVWAYEHLSNSLVKMKIVEDRRYNLIKTSISKRPRTILEDEEAWYASLNSLKTEDIKWECDWPLCKSNIYLHMRDRQSIVLVGLHGSTPYVPLRVLHQFGCVDPFNPTTSDLEDDRVDFTSFSVKKEISYVKTWEQSRQSISAFVQNNTSTISELNQLCPNGSREFVRDYIIPPPPPPPPPERLND